MRSCVVLVTCNVAQGVEKTYHGVPRTCAETERVVAYTETADTVVVSLQCAYTLTAQDIPNLEINQHSVNG
jgi:hypothetical protein